MSAGVRAKLAAMTPAPPARSERLYPVVRGPRQREALRLIEDMPGLTSAGLATALGVPVSRARCIVRALEQAGTVRAVR